MNRKDLNKHWSDQTAKHTGKAAPEPESTDPRKQKIWRKPENPKLAVSVVPEVAETTAAETTKDK